jgi:hypothetical protein
VLHNDFFRRSINAFFFSLAKTVSFFYPSLQVVIRIVHDSELTLERY